MSTAELACSYASLILADEGIEITADKLQTLLTAAKVQDVEPIWTSIFAKVNTLRSRGQGHQGPPDQRCSAGAAAPAAVGGAAAAAGGEAAAPAEEKEEEKEESDEDMGFGLFD
ncbi:hypothetical protein AOCH_002394 [Aspergillus ochraceoroseus]|uniref:Large ribosomal subunit protein P1 n=1 Tax=Aspergillus ochraceoroseus TaxID=138278 RepID=A0A0F8XPI2_9EURO|nr:hypothetical protein AOCH_002394 [Aspergillus ochraceoroseus]